MVERATVTQAVQIGVESTPGTAVAANKRLSSISIEPSAQVDVDVFRAMGYKYPTVTALNKEWVEAAINGQPTYDEIVYLLNSAVGTGVIASMTGAARSHTFTPSSSAADTPKTFTVEVGGAVRAHRFAYGLVTDLGLEISRDGVTVDGTMIGRAIEDGVTLTATPTEIALIPVLPTQFSVYLDTSTAALGTTKLDRVLNVAWRLGSRYNPLWVVDAAQASWVTHVEGVPELTATMLVEADANGMALLSRLRDGATRYLRVEAVGPVIAGADTYKLRIDMAAKISDMSDFSDEDGVYAVEWTLAGVHDGGWTKAFQILVQNTLAAL